MTTIRVGKRQRFTTVDRRTVNDGRLSFGARGLLVWLLDKPDDWTTSVERLADASPQGQYAVRNLVRELEACGYIVRTRTIDPATKRYVAEWEVREIAEPCAETAGGSADLHARKPRVEPCAETAGLIETEVPKTENPPPTPPQAGGGNGEVVPRFKGMATVHDLPVRSNGHLAGNGLSPGSPEREAMVLAAGGWSRPGDVVSQADVVVAFATVVPAAGIPSARGDLRGLVRDSIAMGESAWDFLRALCQTNAFKPGAMQLARSLLDRDDAGLPSAGPARRPSQGPRAEGLAGGHRRTAARRAAQQADRRRGVIDVDVVEG